MALQQPKLEALVGPMIATRFRRKKDTVMMLSTSKPPANFFMSREVRLLMGAEMVLYLYATF